MKTFTTIIMASCLGLSSALPTAEVNEPIPTLPPLTTDSCITTVLTVLATGAPAPQITGAPAAPDANNTTPNNNGTTAVGTNVQAFTGNLGGLPPPVLNTGGERPFTVNGDTFVGSSAAIGRSCDIQHNACANAANAGTLSASVGDCDAQNTACHTANNLKRRQTPPATTTTSLDLGSCSDATILFQTGLDGRGSTGAFVAANQKDFNHGSALNIAVIAGFVCQRLGSPCAAPADSQAACASASAAAVAAAQDQAAADAWNAVMGGGSAGAVGAAPAPAAPAVTPAPLAAMPLPAVQLLTFSSCP